MGKARRVRMRSSLSWIRCLAFVGVLLLPQVNSPVVHASTRAVPAGTLLYRATHWRGWGWRQTHGMLVTRAPLPDADIAPFTPPKGRPYAVQASIQAVGPTYRAGDAAVVAAGFGILVRGSDDVSLPGWYAGPVKGIFTGFVSYPCTVASCASPVCTVPGTDPPCDTAGAGLLWQAFGWYGNRFRPDRRWHTYRLDVWGNAYQLFIDGRAATARVRIPGYDSYRWIGLWSMYYHIKVRDFRVTALAPTRRAAADVTTLERRTLTWSDEVGKPVINAQFLNSRQLARLWQVGTATLDRRGYLLSLSQAWGGGGDTTRPGRTRAVWDVADSLTAFRSVEGSQWGLAEETAIDRRAKEVRTAFQELSIPVVGDDRYAFRFTDGSGNTVMVLDFRRDEYVAHLKLVARPGSDAAVLDELASLGTTVDQRLNRGLQHKRALGLSSRATPASPPVTPTPVPTLTPTQQRAEQVVRAFYAAYNRRDVPAIFALLPNNLRYIDCDYTHHRSVLPQSKPELQRWLRARFREHDRFTLVGAWFADPGPGKVGVVGDVIRTSDSLDRLVGSGLMPADDNGLGKFVVRPNGRLDLVDLVSYSGCAAGTLPHDAKPRKERALAHDFLDAYNRHDVTDVSALLSDNIVYDDCDFSQGKSVESSGKSAVEAWLRTRFAAGDRLTRPRIVLRSWLSQSPNDPRTLVIEANRANTALGTATQPLTVRVVPNPAVSSIRLVQVWGSCSIRVPSYL